MKERILPASFIRLRRYAFLGQFFILVLASGFFKLTLPVYSIAALLLIIPFTNFLFRSRLLRNVPEVTRAGSFLSLDTLVLTVVLYLAGGPTNPFTIVYLLHVVLAAVLLGPGWTWIITALSAAGFSALFIDSVSIPEWSHHGAHHGFSLHLHGMLFAYVTVSTLIAYYLTRLVRELREKERRILRLENIAAGQRQLASLTTITAGAAHELGTPLGTISLIAHELYRTLAEQESDNELLEDLSLLKSEVMRCKDIIHTLSEKSGDLLGEPPKNIMVKDLLEVALSLAERARVKVSGAEDLYLTGVPKRALGLALHSLVKNALDASEAGSIVFLHIEATPSGLILTVKDSGCGMDKETLERVGEPFFSTRETGKGMGLGVYLSKLTFEQLGGSISYTSQKARGTVVTVNLPLSTHLRQAA